MSTITLHVGQCGNQIASPFWRLAEQESDCRGPLFHDCGGVDGWGHGRGYSRSILVDTEPKAVARSVAGLRSIRPSNVCLDHNGRANNWAMGFMTCMEDENKGRGIFHDATNALRLEAERSDQLRSVVLVHSLAGGTGSGLGSAMLQHLRDQYPSLWLMPSALGPFQRGDTPLQHFNALFACQYGDHLSDAMAYSDNDLMVHTLQHTSKRGRATAGGGSSSSSAGGADGGGDPGASSGYSYVLMNDLHAHDLAATLLPTIDQYRGSELL